MNGKLMLYINQYGDRFWARTVKDLRSQIGAGGGRVDKMYVDKKDGRTVHCGYVIGQYWLTAYTPYEAEVKR